MDVMGQDDGTLKQVSEGHPAARPTGTHGLGSHVLAQEQV